MDELLGGVRSRFVDEDGAAILRERVGVGIRLQEGGSVTEVAMRVAERGEHDVQLLAVVGPTPERRGGLDEQHLAVGMLAAMGRRTQLVGEEPQRGVITGTHTAGVPPGSGWDCHGALR